MSTLKRGGGRIVRGGTAGFEIPGEQDLSRDLVAAFLAFLVCEARIPQDFVGKTRRVAFVPIPYGQTGPFNLLTYEDARKHSREIAEMTSKRLMPPWPPDPGFNEFIGQRILTPSQLSKIQQWVLDGTPEGRKEDLSAQPEWPQDWPLGKPDLVVTLPEAYVLPPDGRDVYRNFVAPIPLATTRYVKAIDFRPGNRSVHHADLTV